MIPTGFKSRRYQSEVITRNHRFQGLPVGQPRPTTLVVVILKCALRYCRSSGRTPHANSLPSKVYRPDKRRARGDKERDNLLSGTNCRQRPGACRERMWVGTSLIFASAAKSAWSIQITGWSLEGGLGLSFVLSSRSSRHRVSRWLLITAWSGCRAAVAARGGAALRMPRWMCERSTTNDDAVPPLRASNLVAGNS